MGGRLNGINFLAVYFSSRRQLAISPFHVSLPLHLPADGKCFHSRLFPLNLSLPPFLCLHLKKAKRNIFFVFICPESSRFSLLAKRFFFFHPQNDRY